MPAFNDLTGQKFGRLTAVLVDRTTSRIRWICLCSCGNEVSVSASKLRDGNTQSCGCLRTELAGTHTIKHGHGGNARSKTYSSWAAMLTRCRHADRNYANLTVCAQWLSFDNFLKDMGERPKGTSIERKNNSEGYHPGNCVWANRQTQNCNRTNVLLFEHNGQIKNLSTWCRDLGNLNYAKVYARLMRGASFEEAIK